jgi:hypothetical protein
MRGKENKKYPSCFLFFCFVFLTFLFEENATDFMGEAIFYYYFFFLVEFFVFSFSYTIITRNHIYTNGEQSMWSYLNADWLLHESE